VEGLDHGIFDGLVYSLSLQVVKGVGSRESASSNFLSARLESRVLQRAMDQVLALLEVGVRSLVAGEVRGVDLHRVQAHSLLQLSLHMTLSSVCLRSASASFSPLIKAERPKTHYEGVCPLHQGFPVCPFLRETPLQGTLLIAGYAVFRTRVLGRRRPGRPCPAPVRHATGFP
jgi:hypothetical protein